MNVAYRALNGNWPERYFGAAGSVDVDTSRNIFRYVIFRYSLPLVASAISVNTTANLSSASGWWSVLGLTLSHLSRNVLSIEREYGKLPALRLRRKIIFQIIILVTVTTSMVVGYFLSGVLRSITPEPRDLLLALWTGAAAALGGSYVANFFLKRPDWSVLRARSLNELDQDLIDLAQQEARSRGIDPIIPIGIMIAENIQRPTWIRSAERHVAWVLKSTTFTQGVMQVKSSGPLSDRDSIVKAIQLHQTEWSADVSEPRCSALKQIAQSYNSDYIEVITESIEFARNSLVEG